ncbi:hypothetical protein SESBI_12989 [Sesbania bispinosa]|nr:hypothetical protein SESBI_12989 [Sesbania bispinosa]
MAQTRCTGSRVPHEDPAPSSSPNRYAWVDDGMRDACSVVSEDDVAAYLASLPEPPLLNSSVRIWKFRCDRPILDSTEDWFYVYDYCLTTL